MKSKNKQTKKDTNELIYTTETDTWRTSIWLLGARVEGGRVMGFGIDMFTLLYLK